MIWPPGQQKRKVYWYWNGFFRKICKKNYTKQAGFTDAGMDLVDMDIVAVLNAGSKVYPWLKNDILWYLWQELYMFATCHF